jgi:hypothetical protein
MSARRWWTSGPNGGEALTDTQRASQRLATFIAVGSGLGATVGVLVGGGPRDAQAEALASDRTPITLINGEQLLDLLIDNEIGVTSKPIAILQLGEGTLSESQEDETPGQRDDESSRVTSYYSGSKALSMWPLPGGNHAWKTTLDAMLRHVAEAAPTWDQLVKWIIESFDKVASDKVARGYVVSVMRPLDLVETLVEQVAVTATGAQYLADPTPDALLTIARANVAGFDEIVAELGRGPRTPEMLLETLRRQLGVGWQTDAQVRFRLGWLEVLGAATERDGIWTLSANANT